jgi:AraC-like DNA-binding protein
VYLERASRIPGAAVWTAVAESGATRVLPDGCIDLLWDGRDVRVAGPDTRAHRHESPVGSVMHGLRFAPGAAPAVLGVPAAALTDQQLPLDALWSPAGARAMADRLAAAADASRVLEDEVLGAAGLGAAPPPDAVHIVARLRQGTAVVDVADGLGVSRRQLHRRCLASFGYGPKLLARILRLQRALELARRGVSLADVAAQAGYADQAHLARDVGDLAGAPMRQLL